MGNLKIFRKWNEEERKTNKWDFQILMLNSLKTEFLLCSVVIIIIIQPW